MALRIGHSKLADWPLFKHRLEKNFTANEIDNDNRQRAMC